MTKSEALRYIAQYWGTGTNVPTSVAKRIEMLSESGENILQTLSRVAEAPQFLSIKPFDHASILMLANRLSAMNDIAKVKRCKS